MPSVPSVNAHPEYARLLQAVTVSRERAGGWSGTVYRSATPRYAASADVTSGFGARKHGGRWNPPGSFPAVYGSSTPEVAVAEALASFRYYGISVADALPRTILALSVRLERLLDLTDPTVRWALRVSRRGLRQERWREAQAAGNEALTQAIGRAAHDAGFDALRAPSAAVDAGWNLVAFPRERGQSCRDALFLRNGESAGMHD